MPQPPKSNGTYLRWVMDTNRYPAHCVKMFHDIMLTFEYLTDLLKCLGEDSITSFNSLNDPKSLNERFCMGIKLEKALLEMVE